LIGFFPPTSGTANVNGYDIRKDIANVHSSLGLCPQHDILFDTMTVGQVGGFLQVLRFTPPIKMTATI
jgi:ATP-binding cassette subfamily A (ABC1) protein 3